MPGLSIRFTAANAISGPRLSRSKLANTTTFTLKLKEDFFAPEDFRGVGGGGFIAPRGLATAARAVESRGAAGIKGGSLRGHAAIGPPQTRPLH